MKQQERELASDKQNPSVGKNQTVSGRPITTCSSAANQSGCRKTRRKASGCWFEQHKQKAHMSALAW